MKFLYLLSASLFFTGFAFAQKPCTIITARAYYSVLQPGNIPVDENGRRIRVPAKKQRFLYAVISCSSTPAVISLKYGLHKVSRPSAEKITGNDVLIGKNEKGQNIHLHAAKGTYVWKITADDTDMASEETPEKAVLKLRIGNSIVTRTTAKEIYTAMPERP